MALFDDNSEARTERPTARRRRQARERGQVAHSIELLIAARLLASWFVLAWWFTTFATSASSLLRRTLEHAGSNLLSPSTALMQLRDLSGQFLATASWPLLAATFAILVAHFAQVGWLWRWENAAPQPLRLSPIAGLQRLLSAATVGRGLKLILKATLVVGVIALIVSPLAPWTPAGMSSESTDPMATFGSTAVQLAACVAIALLTFAGLDYAWQRWRFERSLQMTREEVREELKELEGDPQLKNRQQAAARQPSVTLSPPDSSINAASNTESSG